MNDNGVEGGAVVDNAVVDNTVAKTELSLLIERYLRFLTLERGLSDNTREAYRRDLNSYNKHLISESVFAATEITREHISEWIAELRAKGMNPASVARHLSSVRGLHRYLVDEGILESDVALHVLPPRQHQRLPKALTIAQINAILTATSGDDPAALRDRALLEFLYATGARVSEASGLAVDDVIGDGGEVAELVRLFGKGRKQRIVPLGSHARRAIEDYLVRARPLFVKRGRGTPNLFLGVRGAPLSRQSVWLIVQAAAERAGLAADVSPHTFRHSFATHLLEGGADVRVVQELLGHASVATTQLYTLVTADTLRDMYIAAHPRARA